MGEVFRQGDILVTVHMADPQDPAETAPWRNSQSLPMMIVSLFVCSLTKSKIAAMQPCAEEP